MHGGDGSIKDTSRCCGRQAFWPNHCFDPFHRPGYHCVRDKISSLLHHSGMDRMAASNATSAIAFAGNALRKQGKNPRQYPLAPLSL